ncbi:hypothetical protein DH2020_014713 [Rehmannia glutinosa]|uniref:Adrenodoxin-NADP(+) reductase n=1 Tax=Rehmannia glutinosa TaxID=99300 RepID=A0ABR0WX86_REHGL
MASFEKLRSISRSFGTLSSTPLRICVVGSGPAGFYTAEKVMLAYGAESDRSLGIPGEELPGTYAAREFVWWYNGHPDCRNLAPNLENTDTAVILGQGNVALDVARILLRPTAELAKTDIPSHVLGALEESSIRKVYLVGRRGPVQAACTAKELEKFWIEMKNNRTRRRVYELLSNAVTPAHAPVSGQQELHFVFFRKPDRFIESDDRSGHLGGVRLEKTTLKGIVPNHGGRVLADASQDHTQYETGLYVCGWLKRGSTGIIATNLYCAEETLACVSDDIHKGVLTSNSPKPGREGLLHLLNSRNTRVVSFDGWEKIDLEERRRGNLKNKPREKLTTWEELLKVACE